MCYKYHISNRVCSSGLQGQSQSQSQKPKDDRQCINGIEEYINLQYHHIGSWNRENLIQRAVYPVLTVRHTETEADQRIKTNWYKLILITFLCLSFFL